MKKNNKPVTIEYLALTIENLAVMVKRGFDQTATKEDLQELATKVELQEVQLNNVKGAVREIVEELNATHTDVRYIRSTVDKLVHSDIAHDAAIQDLTSRVRRLEQKAGLAR